jgi:AcrR family transcriptional regulator
LRSELESAGPEKILEAAAKLFSVRGFSNVSIRDICGEVHTTPPMIYYYFGNKKGLFYAVIRKKISLGEFISHLKQTESKGNSTEAITAFVDTYLYAFPDKAFDLGLYMRDTATMDRESAGRMSQQLEEIDVIATEIVTRGIKDGDFRKTDPAEAAGCLLGMLNRIVFQRIHFSKSSDIEAGKPYITDFFLRAMK